jgi:hypothetical protein
VGVVADIDLINLNTARINYNISRLDGLLSEDEITGAVPELDAALVQSVSDINEWVNTLAALIASNHTANEAAGDILSIRSISNAFRLDELRTEAGLGIIQDIYTSLLEADQVIRDNFNAYTGTTDAQITALGSRIATLELASIGYLTAADASDIFSQINALSESIDLQIAALTQGLQNQVTKEALDITIQADLVALLLSRIDATDLLISEHYSTIAMTADAIALSVQSMTTYTNGLVSAQSSRIDLTDSSIISIVDRLDITEGITSQQTSSITQLADRITQEVIDRQTLADGTVALLGTQITQTADAIVSVASVNDGLSDRVDTAETRLTATEIVSTVTSENLASTNSYLNSTVTQLAHSYGVVIKETVNGIPYMAGFGFTLHPEWQVSSAVEDVYYTTGDTVTYTDDLIYEALVDHLATDLNSPGSAAAATYWELLPYGMKSEFAVNAEQFAVYSANGTKSAPVFSVNTETDEVTVNGAMIFYGTVQDTPTSLSEISANDAQDLSDANSFISTTYPADQANIEGLIDGKIDSWFTGTDPSDVWLGTNTSHTGDMWWNDTLNELRRYTGTAWSDPLTDQTAIDAYSNAETAQDTADGKRRVFINTPTGPYDIGDLWDSPTGIQRALYSVMTGFSVGDWKLIGDVTADVVGDMAYENMVGLAKLDTTVIDGGHIKTSLLETKALLVGGTEALKLAGIASGADVTASSTAYDTSRVSGTSAYTVKTNAANGATFTSSSYLDYSKVNGTKPPADADKTSANAAGGLITGADISNAKANGYTLISGGYLNTSILTVGNAQIQNAAVGTLSIAGNAVTVPVYANALSHWVTAYVNVGHASIPIVITASLVQSYSSQITLYINFNGGTWAKMWMEQPIEGTLATKSSVHTTTTAGTYGFKLMSSDTRNVNGASLLLLAVQR